MVSGLVAFSIKREAKVENMILGSQCLQMLLLIVFMVVLLGGSFLFLWTLVLTCVTILLVYKGVRWAGLATTIIFVPILYVLSIVLTIGALAVTMLLGGIAMATIIPTAALYLKNK